jgi:uncharacterized membrane protein YccC
MPKLAPQTVVSALNTYAAAMLALYIAFSLDLPRPYWAMMTVYITANPFSGAVRSKAVYRFAGTLLGAGVTIVLVPNLVNEPLLLSLTLALWVGGCLVVSLLDRTPRSYLMLLAGYTVALVGFPAVSQPGAIFDIAVSRVEEIGIGIGCTALMHGLVFPRGIGAVLEARLAAWLRSADGWLVDLADGAETPDSLRDRQALAAAVSDMRIQATHLPFDTSHLRETQAAVRALHVRMLGLIPQLSGVTDRRQALTQSQRRLPRSVQSRLDEVAAWVRAGAAYDASRELVAALRASSASYASRDHWRALLAESLLVNLADIVAAIAECHALLAHVRSPGGRLAPPIEDALRTASAPPLSSDLGLAWRSGAVCVVAIMTTCGIWIGTGWADGATAASLVTVFCALFATLDDPTPSIVTFSAINVVNMVLGALYIFAIFQAIDGFPMLAVVLLPPLFVIGLLLADPKTTPIGVPTAITFAAALSLQSSLRSDFAAYLNGNLGVFVASFVAVVVTRMFRSMTAEASAQRLLRLTWSAIAHRAQHGPAEPGLDFTAVLVDRLALLAPRLALQHEVGAGIAEGALRDVRVAMNLSALRLVRSRLDGEARAGVDRLMDGLAEHYGRLARSGNVDTPAALLPELDSTLSRVAQRADAPDRRAQHHLVGLRRNLFPAAAPFVPASEQPA